MNIVIASTSKEEHVMQIGMNKELHTYTWVSNAGEFADFEEADAFIDFNDDLQDYRHVKKPLLLNQTCNSFSRIQCDPRSTARFCGWPGFAGRSSWEVAVGPSCDIKKLQEIMKSIEKEAIVINDMDGLIAPRVLCTIINEACYAISENISDAAQIDIAMKLGTNYPDGPINWGRRIGGHRIKELLQALSAESSRYTPHESLLKLLS